MQVNGVPINDPGGGARIAGQGLRCERALPNECKWPEGRASNPVQVAGVLINDPGGGARIAGQGLRCE